MTDRLRIKGGRIFDPTHGVDGEVKDVCVEDGRVVAALPKDAPTLDASGLVVMAGGVDIHSHIAGPTVNLARRLQPERRTVPPTLATGRLYSLLGYTTAFDAAVPLPGARHAHLELRDTPILDKGFYVVLGNDELLLRALAAGEDERAMHTIAWALSASRAYGVKVVDPGGFRAWRQGRAAIGLDDPVPGLRLTPRRIIEATAAAVDALGLPHPLHLHCNNLGSAGNATTTLETMRALGQRRAHLAHLQFHGYGGEPGSRPTSRAREVIEALNRSPHLSADVGQVMFGPATTMTADVRVGQMLHELTGHKWVDADLELSGGCGIVPFEYRERNVVHGMQWAAGLELLLLGEDPWRLVLSTDHPNGGTFLSYPRLIRLLMDRAYRDEQIARLKPESLVGSALLDGLGREYSLYEIAIVTRAGPARLLGLGTKGHLGPGADADVTIYAPDADVERMFAIPRHVLKGGVRVAEEGQLRGEPQGRTLHVARDYDPGIEPGIRRALEDEGSLTFEDYLVREEEVWPWS